MSRVQPSNSDIPLLESTLNRHWIRYHSYKRSIQNYPNTFGQYFLNQVSFKVDYKQCLHIWHCTNDLKCYQLIREFFTIVV